MDTSGTPLQYVIDDRLGAFFLINQIYLTTMYLSTIPLPIYLINLLRKLELGLRVALF